MQQSEWFVIITTVYIIFSMMKFLEFLKHTEFIISIKWKCNKLHSFNITFKFITLIEFYWIRIACIRYDKYLKVKNNVNGIGKLFLLTKNSSSLEYFLLNNFNQSLADF